MTEPSSPDHIKTHSSLTQPAETLRWYLLAAVLVTLAGIIAAISETYGLGSWWGFSGGTLLSLVPFYAYILGLLAAINTLGRGRGRALLDFSHALLRLLARLGHLNWVLFILIISFYGYRVLAGLPPLIMVEALQIVVLGHLVLFGGLFLSSTRTFKPREALLVSFSVVGLVLWLFYWLPDVQTYPLSLGWSETTWFYDASLFFSRRIYGFRAPLSSLHPSRYLLQAFPFIFGSLPLWVHRLWQVLLWLVLSLAGSFAITKRINPGNKVLSFGIIAWTTLFLFQGPVYYHLMVVILIVLLGFNRHNLTKSLLFVVLASLWAGISRVNWFPVAGMLAATLYILEQPQGEQPFWRYWRWPLMTALLGLGLGFSAQAVYILLSGRPPGDFVTSFNSPLLWYRLFPNEAFGMGILLMLLIATIAPIALTLWYLLPRLRAWRPLRLLGLLTILGALLIAGVVVSSKIGGGNNLHNLDAFMVFLAIVALYALFDRFVPDEPGRLTPVKTPVVLILLMALIPLNFVWVSLRPYSTWDQARAQTDIEVVQALIDQWATDEGEVLIIQDRHLLTFGMLTGVRLVPEYEKVFLMEKAMSETMPYLARFRQDIQSRRFDVVVIEPLFFQIKPSTEVFSEENNAWVRHVVWPLDQDYQVIFESEESGLSVLIPRPVP